MNHPRLSEYTPQDFQLWQASDELTLTPKFQRRSVWTMAARSFFIDSLLRTMPIPPIYLRMRQSSTSARPIREVIDGQQRVSSMLEFIDGHYRLSKTLDAPWAGKLFDQLSAQEKESINTYRFITVTFQGISDLEVLEIFSRLNTNSVLLNKQELRNGKFFGLFKQSVYSMAHEHLEFWRRHQIFTERKIARMLDAEFVSEIFIAFIGGMQDKKNSIESFYELYNEQFSEKVKIKKRFQATVDEINESVGDNLSHTIFNRAPILYSLFCVIYHRQHGIPGESLDTPKKRLSREERLNLQEAVISLSTKVEAAHETGEIPRREAAFIQACQRQTDNIKPRRVRFKYLYTLAFE